MRWVMTSKWAARIAGIAIALLLFAWSQAEERRRCERTFGEPEKCRALAGW